MTDVPPFAGSARVGGLGSFFPHDCEAAYIRGPADPLPPSMPSLRRHGWIPCGGVAHGRHDQPLPFNPRQHSAYRQLPPFWPADAPAAFRRRTDYLAPGFNRESFHRQDRGRSARRTCRRGGVRAGTGGGDRGNARGGGTRQCRASAPAYRRGDGQLEKSAGEGSSTTPNPLRPRNRDSWALPCPHAASATRPAPRTRWSSASPRPSSTAPTPPLKIAAGPRQAAPAERTTGRRVGLRFELVRLADEEPQWVAHGTGDGLAHPHRPPPPAPHRRRQRGRRPGRRKPEPLPPLPPAPLILSRRLVRRLLAHVPFPIEVQPN